MDKDKIQGRLEQVKGEVKEKWGNLSNDSSKEGEGKLDKAKGKLKEAIGEAKDKILRK